ncbi:MAG: phosphate ABC transporter ATP-binding protein [Acidobacteriota bacterium]
MASTTFHRAPSAPAVEEASPGDDPRFAAPADRPTAFDIEDLSCSYGDKVAFRGVSLRVPRARITALIGPSGCGKTSLLNTLNRLSDLVPGCRIDGRIRLFGRDVWGPDVNPVELRRHVGMIFQKPSPFPLSIRRNLELPLREHGVKDRNEREARIEHSLREVGLWREVKDRLKTSALALSGGQQQRLCMARALVLRPEVILLDEPCSALDPLSSGVVEDLIASFRDRYTVIIVTHNLAQARRISDSTAFFWVVGDAGRLIEHAPTQELFANPRDPLTRAYVNGARG